MDKGFVAQFERKVLFRIARFVAFTICFLLFLSLVGGLLYIGKSLKTEASKPNAQEVVDSLKPIHSAVTSTETTDEDSNAMPLATQPMLRGIRLPAELQELFLTEDNQKVLKDWLDELPESDRQPFIDGLGSAVKAARSAGGVEDIAAINAYHERYFAYVAERKIAEVAAAGERLYVAGAVVSILILLALFSLVLVLLAIERNTRDTAFAGSRQ